MKTIEFLSYICDMLCGNLDDVRAEDVNEICSQCKIAQMAGRIKVLPFEPGQTVYCVVPIEDGHSIEQVTFIDQHWDDGVEFVVLEYPTGRRIYCEIADDQFKLCSSFEQAAVELMKMKEAADEQEKQRGIHGD